MAQIDLDLAHAYRPDPKSDADYALLPLNMTFRDGGAYALLGPSGCGKTTMLNVISGLIQPSHGRVSFGGKDVTALTPQQRNIAQVFQFPVIYDTMTVAENLAFPLRNRGVSSSQVAKRVGQIAEMLEISHQLNQRAAGLSADAKQKISLGRGLVREDVSAVLFDEPLTVIDPHLKWQLRRKLKQIHHELKLTLIYVTHDQIEALTFAQEIVVMTRGRAVQTGSADELFERPRHTFVGNFIGSPGMNFLPVRCVGNQIMLGAHALEIPPQAREVQLASLEDFVLGVRPEYVELVHGPQAAAIPVRVLRAQDVGTHWVLTASVEVSAQADPVVIRARLPAQAQVPAIGVSAWFKIMSAHTRFYKNEEMIA